MQDDPDHALGALFEDLEQQAAGLELTERDAELADRAQGEYAGVTLASRVHASLGRAVVMSLRGGDVVAGTLSGAGADWCTVDAETETGAHDQWLVRLAEVVQLRGVSERAVPEAARPVVARLGFGSALRRMGAEVPVLSVQPVVGPPLGVRVLRVGADFAELVLSEGPAAGEPLLVAFAGIRTVRSG